jgi:Sec-independent protein secretion pathway component TatC
MPWTDEHPESQARSGRQIISSVIAFIIGAAFVFFVCLWGVQEVDKSFQQDSVQSYSPR